MVSTDDYPASICEGSLQSNSEKKFSSKEAYVPVNFIPEEIYAMIAAWEEGESAATKGDAACSKKDVVSTSGNRDAFEPSPRMHAPVLSDLPSPSRFQRCAKNSNVLKLLCPF